MMMMSADPSTTEMLDVIVRAALQREYTKGGSVTNGQAFADAVKRSHVDNETSIPGSLKIAYLAARKTLEPVVTANTAAYNAWQPEEPTEPPATPEQVAYWLGKLRSRFGAPQSVGSLKPIGMLIPTPPPPIDDDDIPGYGDAA